MASKNDDFFGGMFDFNGDGKIDPAERFIEHEIFEEVTKEENPDSDDLDDEEYTPGRSYKRPDMWRSKTPPPAQPIPESLSFEEYEIRRKGFIEGVVISLLIAAVLCLIPGAIAWAAITMYDGESALVNVIFGLGGLVFVVLIISAYASGISESYKRLKKEKEAYLKNAAKEELESRAKSKKKRVILICAILCAGLVLLIGSSAIKYYRLVAAYEEAESLIAGGQYEQASTVLEAIKERGYKDTEALILLCKAHSQYEAGELVGAHYTIENAQFRYQTEKQNAEISSFKAMLEQEVEDYCSDRAEKNRQEYEDRITNGVPFVGMSESRINDTTLGRPSYEVRHAYQRMKSGEQYLANIYDFYQDGKCIFIACCVQGIVTEVLDQREDPQTPSAPNKSGGKTYGTAPAANEFSNPEDFYYWYADDFVDLEEAEDYYYSHGGE